MNELNQVVEFRVTGVLIWDELHLETNWIDQVYTSKKFSNHSLNVYIFNSFIFRFQRLQIQTLVIIICIRDLFGNLNKE